MRKQDIVTQVVSSVCDSNVILDGLKQIENKKRESLEIVVILGLKKRTLKQKDLLLDPEVLDSLVGIIGYQIQDRTGIDFGYCDEECMNGNYDVGSSFTCDHVKNTCKYVPMEENLGESDKKLLSEENPIFDYEGDMGVLLGRLQFNLEEEKVMNVSSSFDSVAMFFCSHYGQDLS